jgi:hypothetical protein
MMRPTEPGARRIPPPAAARVQLWLPLPAALGALVYWARRWGEPAPAVGDLLVPLVPLVLAIIAQRFPLPLGPLCWPLGSSASSRRPLEHRSACGGGG